MGKISKVRKSGHSLILTVPAHIAQLYGIKEGSEVEFEMFSKDVMMLKVVK
jgi:antitoxin component of MazEF toxin-antitoxin module